MTTSKGRCFSPEFHAILSMNPGDEQLLRGVSLNKIHNISKTLHKYGAPVRCRMTNQGVRVCRLSPGERPVNIRGTTFELETGKWRAQICRGRKVQFIGRFATESEAHQAYLEVRNGHREGQSAIQHSVGS